MASFGDKFKSFIGWGDEGEEYADMDDQYLDYGDEVAEDNREERTVTRTTKSRENVLDMPRNSQMTICIHEPLSYEESPAIVDDLRLRKSIILNFEQLDLEVKRQIFDFVNGALYALDGKIQKVNKDIFILAPVNVTIDGLKEELKDKGVFPW
ncbi:MAG: cell division protein SepF [Tissierellia bacterium]|nr:cell division protein SepF [Tissierellia bacterium]